MKKILSAILVLTIIFSLFSICGMSVSAAEAGTSPNNPIKLTDRQWYTRSWTNANYDAKCYNKIIVPSKGYIKFILQKPVDSEGEVCSYDLTLYNSKGDIVWEGDKSAENDIFNDYYIYKIGLAAGTYFMDINPSFYVSSYSAPIKTKYRFMFTASTAWEVENNNDFKTATAISLNKKYSAVIDESVYDQDYFKVKLTKGQKYTITFSNYNNDTSYYFYDPSQDMKSFTSEDYDWYYGKETIKNNNLIWTFSAKKSGYHYIYVSDWADEDVPYTIKVSSPKISISKCKLKLSDTSYTYNGKAKTPTVTVKDSSGKTLKKNTDYTVTYASGRKNVGTYKVTIKMKGNYSGTKTLTFKINPPKTTVSKLTAGKKSITVAITKKATQVTGYQIQYSTSKKFTNAKTKTITSYKTTKYTLKSLSAKKTYYVRVRTYKTVNGKKIYSNWSSYKYIKTK